MTGQAERMQILDMIESGKISADDGLTLLRALVTNQPETAEDEGTVEENWLEEKTQLEASMRSMSFQTQSTLDRSIHPELEISDAQKESTSNQTKFRQETSAYTTSSIPIETQKWRHFWMIPFWIGIAILIAGGGLMFWTLEAKGIGIGFIFASLPFILGLAIILLAWQSRTSPWIHVRITQSPGEKPENIALSFPLPIRPTLWFFRNFGGRMPEIQNISLDEILFAVEQSSKTESPIYIQVDEGERGEKVEIYIG